MERKQYLRKSKLQKRLCEMLIKENSRSFTIYATDDKQSKANAETLKREIKEALKPNTESYIFYIEKTEKGYLRIKGYLVLLNEEALKESLPKGLYISIRKEYESKPIVSQLKANRESNEMLGKETICSRKRNASKASQSKKAKPIKPKKAAEANSQEAEEARIKLLKQKGYLK